MGQVEGIAGGLVVGAINAVATHPTDATVVYIGAVNGGIWKTTNATAADPSWQRQTDDQDSLSIGALAFDPTDATRQTLLAGIGVFSSFFAGGARTGLLRTTDGGANWTPIDGGGTLVGLDITGVAPRGGTLVISAATGPRTGILRSTTTGAAWTQISGGAGTGLPAGPSFDLASDPSDPTRLFTNGGTSGIFRSLDTGATWTKVSNAAIDALLSGATGNLEISVGTGGSVYVAIANRGQLAGLFRSGDGGATWTALDQPTTVEDGGVTFGLHPGSQGETHFSLAADPGNANIVYIGGDRQPFFTEGTTQGSPFFPNSLGARDFSGRLFRVDASRQPGAQAAHLTHSRFRGAAGGGTANDSSPHADSRDMAVDANGDLIETDDGGIYRRTNPRDNTGDWFSMNGDLQTTEFHDVAWDANADIVIGGAQDTGTPEQRLPSNARWRSVSTADGGDVAVDDTSTPGFSVRYSSNQNLGGFRRRVFDAGNNPRGQAFPRLTVVGGGARLRPQFVTPIELNNVDATRLIIGGANSVYESFDQGDTITEIGRGIRINGTGRDPIAYGAAGNANMLYVGSGTRVLVRTAAAPSPLTLSAAYPATGLVNDIAIDPGDPNRAYVIDADHVYRTANAGATWAEVTGDLPTLAPGTLRAIAYVTSGPGSVVVGSDVGAFVADGPTFDDWERLGTGLPTVPVRDLDYDAGDDILVAGTLGRGAWTLDLSRRGGPAPGIIDWNATPTAPYADQDRVGNVSVADGGATLALEGNRWRRTTTTFDVTPFTTLEFDFRSTSQGEIHGIGFDEDDLLSNDARIFQLFGTQSWGNAIHAYDGAYSTLGSTMTYRIPVGAFYTGTGLRLVLVNDKDAEPPDNTGSFSNVRVFENPPGAPPLDFNALATEAYSNQDRAGTFTVEDAGATFFLEGNRWRRTVQSFTISPGTVVAFEFQSTSQGEIHGLGFDENQDLEDAARIFRLFGTQSWTGDIDTFRPYEIGELGTFKTYVIPVGRFYTGSGFRLVLVNDKDAGAADNTSRFRNVRIYELP